MNTFTEALELAYAEAWRLGEEYYKYESGELAVTGGAEGKKMATDRAMGESIGAQRVLGVLLHARGEVGLRSYPARPDDIQPDIQQVWIRLAQWAVSRGLTPQSKLDEALKGTQLAAALEELGKDCLAPETERQTA